MCVRLTPRSMTLNDLELYKFEFSENFAGVRRFGRQQLSQQQLNTNKHILSATSCGQPTEYTFQRYVPCVDLP